jgi:hypothetical protein
VLTITYISLLAIVIILGSYEITSFTLPNSLKVIKDAQYANSPLILGPYNSSDLAFILTVMSFIPVFIGFYKQKLWAVYAYFLLSIGTWIIATIGGAPTIETHADTLFTYLLSSLGDITATLIYINNKFNDEASA